MTILPGPNEKFPFKVECGKPNCFYHSLMRTLDEARRWDDPKEHKCPRGVDTMIGASMTMSLLEKAWKRYDEIIAQIQATPKDDPERVRLLGMSRGFSEFLAIFMIPHFRTPEEVGREALRRWRVAQEGEEPQTPGIGALKYVFPHDDKYKTMLARAADRKARSEKPTAAITKVDINPTLRANIELLKGSFTAEQAVKIYTEVSAATIQRIWDEMA